MGSLFYFLILYLLFKLLFSREDSNSSRTTNGQGSYQSRAYGRNAKQDFIESLLVLIAAMMKADGQVKKVELDCVKRILLGNLGEAQTREALLRLRDILKTNIDTNTVCMTIRYSVDYSTRLQIIHILYGIALADGVVTTEEKNLVFNIGYAIGLSVADIESLFGTYKDFSQGGNDNLEDAYKVLEINKDATDDEVKKAYRNMAKKYHPDTVAQLGEEAQKAAEQKFKKLKDAYEKVKEARGMK